MKRDDLGNRMKAYENCYRIYLPRRQALVLRLDGKSFHSYTKGFKRPYDETFASAMWYTAKRLAENISGAKVVFTESDEISIVLTDYETINTEPWFGNNLQKIVSVSASMASIFFKESFTASVDLLRTEAAMGKAQALSDFNIYGKVYAKALTEKLGVFDARIMVMPREEVVNYMAWRQQDTKRNSIQLAAQANFPHKELQGLDSNQLQEKLFQERGINWAKYPNWFKNGVAIYKCPTEVEIKADDEETFTITRNKWYIDLETPVFTQDRNFIEKHITFER